MLRRQACDRCHRRKQRCDRVLPVCSNCRSAAASCQQRQISVAVPGDDGAGAERVDVPSGEGYVASLKRRIAHLENRQTNKRPRLDRDRPSGTAEQGSSEDASLREALREFRHVVLRSMAADAGDDGGRSQGHIGTWTVFDAAVAASRPAADDEQDSASIHGPQQNEVLKLPRKMSRSLLDRYVEFIAPGYAFCDSAALKRDYEALESADRGGIQALAASAPHRIVIVYMALATAAFTSDSISTRSYALQLHTAASNVLQPSISRMSPLLALHCIVSCAICSLYAGSCGSAWSLIGIAVSKALSLGLHNLSLEDPDSSNERLVRDNQTGERLFWVIYLLDRQMSWALSRPFAIEDRDIATRMPTASANGELRQLVDSLRLARLYSRLREHRARDFSYHAGEYYHFRDSASPDENGNEVVQRENLLRCRCRAMTAIFLIQAGERDTPAPSAKLWMALAEEMIAVSQNWLQITFEQSDDDQVLFSVLNAYEITQVALTCCVLSSKAVGAELESSYSGRASTVVGSAIAVLSTLIARYPSVKGLRKVLVACQRKLTCASSQASSDDTEVLMNQYDIPRSMIQLLEIVLYR